MRSTSGTRNRVVGRPLIAALALISGWIAIRASTWEPPFPIAAKDALFAQAKLPYAPAELARNGDTEGASPIAEGLAEGRRREPALARIGREAKALFPTASVIRMRSGDGLKTGPLDSDGPMGERARLLAGHQTLFASALSLSATGEGPFVLTLADAATSKPGRGSRVLPVLLQANPSAAPANAAQPKPGRWSADAWLLMRQGGGSVRLTSANPAAYGGNQAGAVVRFALAPTSPLAPDIYARASKALVSGGESEVAAGVSVSLARSFPLRAQAEVRVAERQGGAIEARPAVLVVTGLPPSTEGQGLEAEGYLQAGYVGGDFATGFVDGKATLAAPVIQSDHARFTVGGGAWGGAQRDASRLDVGPTASVTLTTGRTTLRASVDYRVRVAGDANPGNGVAVTLAASF